MAELTGAVVAEAERLIVMDNKVYYRAPEGGFQRVAIIHRLALDSMLDPLCFDENTPCGIPHLMEAYSARTYRNPQRTGLLSGGGSGAALLYPHHDPLLFK